MAELLAKRARVDADVSRALKGLADGQNRADRERDQRQKRRRDEERRHYEALTRETERQARAAAAMPRGPIIIDFAALPEQITEHFFAANPRDTDALRLGEEIRLIRERLRQTKFRDSVRLESRWAVRPNDLLDALNEHRPHVVHFSGHGNEDEIAFEDAEGNTKTVSKSAIAQLMATVTDNIRVVIFNTCYSAEQAEAVTTSIDVAIGMNTSIGDEAARVFAAAFYAAVGWGRSVAQAFEQARLELVLQGVPEEDVPEIFVKPGVSAEQVVLVRPSSALS